ncbi:hypothetical protein E2P81_ATG02778 [Venturia nashicola]|nr:hypothetical protein E2P81_ATG02778 [Venturia nashicola]
MRMQPFRAPAQPLVCPLDSVTLNWLITGPYDSLWDQKFRVLFASQDWSPCGTIAPLTFQWSVKFTPNTKTLASLFQSPGKLGKTTSAGGNLILAFKTRRYAYTAAARETDTKTTTR